MVTATVEKRKGHEMVSRGLGKLLMVKSWKTRISGRRSASFLQVEKCHSAGWVQLWPVAGGGDCTMKRLTLRVDVFGNSSLRISISFTRL